MNQAAVVGENIKERRIQAGLSQKQLADLVQTSEAYIAHLEAGRRVPSLGMLLKLSLALGLKGAGTLMEK